MCVLWLLTVPLTVLLLWLSWLLLLLFVLRVCVYLSVFGAINVCVEYSYTCQTSLPDVVSVRLLLPGSAGANRPAARTAAGDVFGAA